MKWRVTVIYVAADGTTNTKVREFPSRPSSVQHWGDRRSLILADGFSWHICNINEIVMEKIES